jgi:uncharacterized membrane protein
MSDLVVIAFPTEAKAEEVRQKILELQKEYLIELGDAAIAVKQPDGSVKLNQLVNTTAMGAVSGTFWGTLVGLIFLMPLAGAALGAASGALGGALTDVGVNDAFMKEVGQTLQSGSAALFLLIRKLTTDKVLEDLKGVGGTVLRTSFDHTKEDALRAALAGISPPRPPERDGNHPRVGAFFAPRALAGRAEPVRGALARSRSSSGFCTEFRYQENRAHTGIYSPSRCSTTSRRCWAARCSNKYIPCQVPRTNRPEAMGMVSCVGKSAALICAGMSSGPSRDILPPNPGRNLCRELGETFAMSLNLEAMERLTHWNNQGFEGFPGWDFK